jgi:hypothetical protein
MSTDHLEKLTADHLAKKTACNVWNPEVNYHIHNIPSIMPVLSQMNPVHTLTPYSFTINFSAMKIILLGSGTMQVGRNLFSAVQNHTAHSATAPHGQNK